MARQELWDSLGRPDQPTRVALRDGRGREWDRGMVGRRIRQLAGWLREEGIGPGDRVVVHLPPGRKTVTDVLGVLAAGACWVPLAADLPTEQAQTLLAAIQPRLVITDAVRCDRFAALAPLLLVHAPFDLPAAPDSCRRVAFDEVNRRDDSWDGPGEVPASDQPVMIFPVGGPGGEIALPPIPSAWVGPYLCWVQEMMDLAPGQEVLSTASPASHEFLIGVVAPLLSGGTVVLDRMDPMDPAPLGRSLEKVAKAFLPLDQVRQLAGCMQAAVSGTEREEPRLFTLGEPCTPEEVEVLTEMLEPWGLYRFTGREETLAYACARQGASDPGKEGGLPLGELAPLWMPPELHLRATAPLILRSRLFAGSVVESGDRVREDRSGALHYAGRRDRQLWWRGGSLSLDALERELQALPGVSQARVSLEYATSPRGIDRPELVAYLEAPGGPDATAWRRLLALRLASRQTPDRLWALRAFPGPERDRGELALRECADEEGVEC